MIKKAVSLNYLGGLGPKSLCVSVRGLNWEGHIANHKSLMMLVSNIYGFKVWEKCQDSKFETHPK